MNKKQKRNIGIGIFVILILIVGFHFKLSILRGGSKINCIPLGEKWECSASGLGGSYFDNFRINKPTNADIYISSLCDSLSAVSYENCPIQGKTEPSGPYRSKMATLINQRLKNKMVIIEGTYNNNPFKTYGLCNATDRNCNVIDPFPQTSQNIEVSNITLYFKDGGYNKNNICKFGFNCPNTIKIYRFEDNNCIYKEVLANQKQDNDYNTLEECKKHISSTFPFFVFFDLLILGGGVITYLYIKKEWQR